MGEAATSQDLPGDPMATSKIKSIKVKVSANPVKAGVAYGLEGVADGPFSSASNIQWTTEQTGSPDLWKSSDSGVKVGLSKDGKTVTISGIVSKHAAQHNARIRDKGASVASDATVYGVVAAPTPAPTQAPTPSPTTAPNKQSLTIAVAAKAVAGQPFPVSVVATKPLSAGNLQVGLDGAFVAVSPPPVLLNDSFVAVFSAIVSSSGAYELSVRDKMSGTISAPVTVKVSPANSGPSPTEPPLPAMQATQVFELIQQVGNLMGEAEQVFSGLPKPLHN